MIRVVCWLWQNAGPVRNRLPYTAEHVNVFARMVERNLRMPHEIVCITDIPEGIDGGVRIVPLWDDGLRQKGACYVRLKAFSPEMADIIGSRFVSVDLDSVITGPLDPLFDRPNDFVMWKNSGRGSLYCGSMFLMTAGARRQVWERFRLDDLRFDTLRADKTHEKGKWVHPRSLGAGNVVGSDQAWISTVLGDGEAMWDIPDGVYSFNRDFNRGGGTRKLKGRQERLARKVLPDNCRIVFFHGLHDPSEPEIQDRFPWVREHWR